MSTEIILNESVSLWSQKIVAILTILWETDHGDFNDENHVYGDEDKFKQKQQVIEAESKDAKDL